MMGYVAAGAGSLAGVVFGVSSISKARSGAAFSTFTGAMGALPFVPYGWERRAALAIVVAEAVVAVTSPLVLPRMLLAKTPYVPVLPLVWAVVAVLLLGLAGAAFVARERGPRARHTGTAACATTTFRILRKFALAAIASLGVVSGIVARPGEPDLAGGMLASLAGAAIASLFIYFDDIAEVFALNRVPHSTGDRK
ncbi:hypothetical protein Skr01_01450 [Sphaerisporangium krabiense]|uniref:Amino acid transporter n=1 Tax=Sphaerisporangium krabiense TaxID=763782 RepID=A0A7W8Z855_9ACTN|nr:hypothetical protein [Sphaerisporangium krabiense]MBB5629100.1 amino acid transporter [Sphaerisporangium krabiense]GII60060.1 hypothetical protein Skr01_01450 [Sphaerisporangium krabiense]